jgi:hypothetical protein
MIWSDESGSGVAQFQFIFIKPGGLHASAFVSFDGHARSVIQGSWVPGAIAARKQMSIEITA